MLTILGRTSSINVRKVLWLLDELGLAYKQEVWGKPDRDPQVAEFLALNPNGLVPVIIEDGFVLWESSAILRYLAEQTPEAGFIPPDRRERAHCNQWLDWQGITLPPRWWYAFFALGRPRPGFDDPVRIAQSVKDWTAAMAMLEGRLAATGAYVAGPAISIADIALGLSAHRWFATPMKQAELPHCRAYYERLKARPAAARYLTAELN